MSLEAIPNVFEDRTDGKWVTMSVFLESEIDFCERLETESGEYVVKLEPRELSSNIRSKDAEESDPVDTWIHHVDPFKVEEFRRDAVATIVHRPSERENHVLRFVLDRTNHVYEGQLLGPHVNIRGEHQHVIQSDGCKECHQYFDDWGHTEVSFRDLNNKFKEPDWERTYRRMKSLLRDAGFFEDYSITSI